MKELASLAATNSRNIVAEYIHRGDYIHLSAKDFTSWMDLNKEHLFSHEIDAMERHRAAQNSKKATPGRS